MKTIAQQLNIKYFPVEIYDGTGHCVYYEDWGEYWYKREFDSVGNEIYFEESDGYIRDGRITELTLDEVADKFGISAKNLKIKKG